MNKLICLLVLLCALPSLAQNTAPVMASGGDSAKPSSCNQPYLYMATDSQTLYTCSNGVLASVTGGTGTFQNLTSTTGFQAVPPSLLDVVFAEDLTSTCAYLAPLLTNGQVELCNIGNGGLTINPGTGPIPITETINNGTAAMTTGSIGSGACGSTVTIPAYGILSTDVIAWSYSTPIAANPGVLIVNVWPTANAVNFTYCNPTSGSVTPVATTLNWRTIR